MVLKFTMLIVEMKLTCLLQILIIFSDIFRLIKTSTSQDIIIQNNSHCSICNLGFTGRVDSHPIPNMFPLLKIENTIYPLEQDQNEIPTFLIGQHHSKSFFKHMRCSIMTIRFAMLKKMADDSNDQAIKTLYGQEDPNQIIISEMYWIAYVLLTLRYVKHENNLQNTERDLNCVIKYLAITIPDLFSSLRVCLNDIIEKLQINERDESVQNLVLKFIVEENMYKPYLLSEKNKMELNILFSMPDTYFLYLLIRFNKFSQIYPLPEVMKFLCSERFAEQNSLVESSDVHKTVFIALITASFKQSQMRLLKGFLNFGKAFQKGVKNDCNFSIHPNEILQIAEQYKNIFNSENETNFLRGIALNLSCATLAVNKIIGALHKHPEPLNETDKACITKMYFFHSTFTNLYAPQVYLQKINMQQIYTEPYAKLLKKTIDFKTHLKSTKLSIRNIFDAYTSKNLKHNSLDSIHHSHFCHKCRLLTCTIFYSLNFVMHHDLEMAVKYHQELLSHKLSNNFKVRMALKTAFYAYYLWNHKRI